MFGGVTVCPRSLDPFYIISNNMKWGKTSWTYGRNTNPHLDTKSNIKLKKSLQKRAWGHDKLRVCFRKIYKLSL